MNRTRLLLVGCCFFLGAAGPGAAQESAEQAARRIIQQAIAAHGGKENLVKSAGAYVTRGKGSMYPANSPFRAFTFEYWHGDSSHTRLELHIGWKDGYIPSVRVLNGADGWEQQGDSCRDLSGSELKAARQAAYEIKVSLLYPLLEEPAFTLAPLGESPVRGHDTIGVKVGYPGQPEVRLYFDKASGLLIKSEALETVGDKTVLREEFYSNYQDVLGRKYPLEVLFLLDGKKYLEIETAEMQPLAGIDPRKFMRP
jgi:hypothetical protein